MSNTGGGTVATTGAGGAAAEVTAAELFAGPGEMRGRCRALDWAATPLGAVATWPVSLRTLVATLLAARHPMILFWGPERVQVYNDAYVPTLGGADRHPAALGMRAADCWTGAVWAIVGPQLEAVVATGEATWHEDQYVPLPRHGRVEDTYWTYSYGPAYDDAGSVAGVLVVTQETTARVLADRERQAHEAAAAAERERLRALVLRAPMPMALLEGPEHRYALVNDAFRAVSGGGRDVTGLTVRAAFPEVAGQGIYERLDRVYATGEPWAGRETLVRYDRQGAGVEDVWFDLRYDPVRDATGRVTGILSTSVDVTAEVRAHREVERLLGESERAGTSLEAANAQLQDQQLELELANQQLQDQAVEMELQAEELQATAAQLEEQTEAAERARQVAEAERARATGVLESMADSYFALDEDFRIVAVNTAMERNVGMPREELLGRSMWEMVPGTVGNVFEQNYRRTAAELTPAHFTHDYSDGRLDLVTEVDIYPAPGGGIAVFWRDVTASARAEAALRESEALARQLFALSPVPKWVYDAETLALLDVNEAAVRHYGYTREEFLAMTIRDIRPPDEIPRMLAVAQAPHTTGGSQGVYRHRIKSGAIIDVEIFLRDVSYEGRRAVIVVVQDITERRRAEAALVEAGRLAEAAREEAEAGNRAKSEFLAVMSHELRTPLNAIGGYAELIELGIHGPVTDAQRTALARIQSSQRHLLGLISGVLDYSRVEAGAVTYRIADVPVAEAVAEAEALVAPQLRGKGLGYGWSGAPPGLSVRADREKLQQILLNLLGNAVKFTNARDGVPGRVEVACSLEAGVGGAGAGDRVRIHVRDTGAGISAEELERIFEPFVQVDQRLTRPHAGVGLGLAISRDLARGMGGDLTAESVPRVGSTFTLTLPRA